MAEECSWSLHHVQSRNGPQLPNLRLLATVGPVSHIGLNFKEQTRRRLFSLINHVQFDLDFVLFQRHWRVLALLVFIRNNWVNPVLVQQGIVKSDPGAALDLLQIKIYCPGVTFGLAVQKVNLTLFHGIIHPASQLVQIPLVGSRRSRCSTRYLRTVRIRVHGPRIADTLLSVKTLLANTAIDSVGVLSFCF